jgi:hypothetical protein
MHFSRFVFLTINTADLRGEKKKDIPLAGVRNGVIVELLPQMEKTIP